MSKSSAPIAASWRSSLKPPRGAPDTAVNAPPLNTLGGLVLLVAGLVGLGWLTTPITRL